MTFASAGRSSGFLEEAGKLQYEIDPIDEAGAQELLGKLYGVPRETVDKLIAIKKRR